MREKNDVVQMSVLDIVVFQRPLDGFVNVIAEDDAAGLGVEGTVEVDDEILVEENLSL